jgi:hypothetical protein
MSNRNRFLVTLLAVCLAVAFAVVPRVSAYRGAWIDLGGVTYAVAPTAPEFVQCKQDSVIGIARTGSTTISFDCWNNLNAPVTLTWSIVSVATLNTGEKLTVSGNSGSMAAGSGSACRAGGSLTSSGLRNKQNYSVTWRGTYDNNGLVVSVQFTGMVSTSGSHTGRGCP